MKGIKPMRTKKTYPQKLKAIIISEVKSGVDYKVVANKFGIPKSTVHSWCFDKRRSPSNNIPSTKTDDMLNKIVTHLQNIEAYLDVLLDNKSQKEPSV